MVEYGLSKWCDSFDDVYDDGGTDFNDLQTTFDDAYAKVDIGNTGEDDKYDDSDIVSTTFDDTYGDRNTGEDNKLLKWWYDGIYLNVILCNYERSKLCPIVACDNQNMGIFF